MKLSFLKLLSGFLVFAALAGCNSLTRSGRVTTTVVDFRPSQASLLETQAQLTLRYVNEEAEDLELSGSVHELYLNGGYVGKAVSKDSLALPRLSSATQTVTVFLENLALIQKLQGLQGMQAISYRLDSQLYVGTAKESRRIRTSCTGQLDLSALNSVIHE
jgi:LEA14-like dessication related protein